MTPRDPVEEIIAFNRPLLTAERVVRRDGEPGSLTADLTAEAVSRKLEALSRSPFAFFRGTFHLMACDLLQARVEQAAPMAPEGLAVGDLHLENFGAYRGSSGALCFDVNDFDDVGWAPVDLDLKRVCTSALLLPSLPHGTLLATARAVASSWAESIERLGGRFPIVPWTREHADGFVKDLLDEKAAKRAEDLALKVAPGKHRTEFGDGGTPPKYLRPEKKWVKVVEKSLEEYLRSLDQLKAQFPGGEWKLLDVAYRFKGTGSLGRLRFDVLVGRDDERKVLELKEARPSALDEARGLACSMPRARVQTAAIRRLQGDPWPRVAGTHLGELSALGREIEPEEDKIASDGFANGADSRHDGLLSYARQCGEVLARLHCRANAPLLLNTSWSAREAAKIAVTFAESYAKVVLADFNAYATARPRIALALTPPRSGANESAGKLISRPIPGGATDEGVKPGP